MKQRNIHWVLLAFCLMNASCGNDEDDVTKNLPPDPGETGYLTLEGVDSDNDGLRDDVQRFIVIEHKNSERDRVALRNLAIADQSFFLSDGAAAARENAEASFQLRDCFYDLHSSTDEAFNQAKLDDDALFSQVINTAERMHAYAKAESLISGAHFKLTDAPLAEKCGFDPMKLKN